MDKTIPKKYKMRFLRTGAALVVTGASVATMTPSFALFDGVAAAAEIATLTTDVQPVGLAMVTVGVFVYGFRVIRNMIR
jgi:hypothetical protein